MDKEIFKVSFLNIIRGLFLIRKPPIRRAAFSIVRNFWNEYHKVQIEKSPVMYNVELPEDKEIPYWGNGWVIYISYGFALASFLGYLHKTRGDETIQDIKNFLANFSEFYIDAGKVFRKAPTSFVRTGGGWFSQMFRSIVDGDRNAAPSVHVIQAAFIYSGCSSLATKYSLEEYDKINLAVFKISCRVIDATLLVKQHCIIDVSSALAVVAMKYPEFMQDTEKIMSNIFTYSNASIPEETNLKVRSIIREQYDSIVATAKRSTVVDSIIEHIQKLHKIV